MRSTRPPLLVTLGILLAVIFAVDLFLPLGVAAGVPYILPVLLSLRAPGRQLTVQVSVLATLLTVAGYFLSPPAGIQWMVLANRGLAIGAVWIVALLLLERKRMRESIHEADERLRAIFEAAPDGILVIDERGRIETFNRGAAELFGYDESEIIGQNVSMLMPSPHAEQHDGFLAEYLVTGVGKVIGKEREVLGKRKDGSVVPLRLSVGEAEIQGRRAFTGILHDLSAIRRAEKDSLEDSLTALPNRRAFDKHLASALSRSETSLILLDVDRLKTINDELGHLRGDEALAEAASRIRSSLRATDVGNASRIGGDEFAVVLPDTAKQVALRIAERVFDKTQPTLAAIHSASGVSVGVASSPAGTPPEKLLELADQALYRAKQERGRVSV